MEAKAIARTVRIAPRKARLVIDLIRGKNIKEARAILMFTPKAASPIITKVLNSAIANATHNLSMNEEKLFVKEVWVNESMTMKRMLPRAKGTGNLIKKRTSHITVVVAEKE
ncbi:50S ribosomal protein L22 [Acholeplasma equirhinis]|uniref:50S ribosomal protein L22 n=1 Tax=Acholeplasma equirhinis TaxID=555393 RepID=UPI00197A77D1|nr:50S ribosomal protein L22 [Acholeplasma equirhinis]MBN3490951.1 50S ribosomal protein L22 [Acholeplasma equirhinis]